MVTIHKTTMPLVPFQHNVHHHFDVILSDLPRYHITVTDIWDANVPLHYPTILSINFQNFTLSYLYLNHYQEHMS